jgi:hypothetical protein
LIVFDQFEQWLRAHPNCDTSELAAALGQCDGSRVQALIVVRDDFWSALNRLLQPIEVDLSMGRNMAAVDTFDPRHARAVLAAFGRGHGALPDDPETFDEAQRQFLDSAIEGLTEAGRIVCVRLAVFAEVLKDRPWTPNTLDEIDGVRGVEIAFLESVLGERAQHPVLRPHRTEAEAVLKALVPAEGSDFVGEHRQSVRELIAAAGFIGPPREFEAVLRVLDRELRLITPTEPPSDAGMNSGQDVHYQLRHDFLIPSVREWLETGRNAKPRITKGRLSWIRKGINARMTYRTLAAAAVILLTLGLAMLHLRGRADAVRFRPIRPLASPMPMHALHRPRPSELRKRLNDQENLPETRLIAALTLLADSSDLDPDEKEALAEECRRLLDECLVATVPSSPVP